MQRAVSATRLNHSNRHPNLSKSPSLRAVYINQETNKRSVNTHFHSPFKQGKRNRDYVNPSFVSNHLFYPKEMIEKKTEVVVRNSYIPNAGELARQNQYRDRIRTETNAYNQLLEKTQQYQRKVKQQMNQVQVRGSRLVEPEQLLKKELNSLINYREKIDTVKERQKINKEQIPPYFEKKRRDNTFESDFLDYKQKAIQQYLKQYNQQKSQQKQKKRDQRQKENLHIQKNMAQNSKQNVVREKILKEKSSLLGTILKEQMLIRNKSKVFA